MAVVSEPETGGTFPGTPHTAAAAQFLLAGVVSLADERSKQCSLGYGAGAYGICSPPRGVSAVVSTADLEEKKQH